MLATIHDDTWNVLNMQYITPNTKRWDYSDIHGSGYNVNFVTWKDGLYIET